MKRKNDDTSLDLFGAQCEPPGTGSNDDKSPCADASVTVAIASTAVNAAHDLIERRSLSLGNILVSDHAAEYVAILRAFVDFRTRHEPEPLHEDLESAVCGEDADAASRNAFKAYLRQLTEWDLVSERIEKERLRGYRDTRRTKFRYRLCNDAIALTAWLSEMRERDLNPVSTDLTGNLLDLQRSLVSELKRMLHRVNPSDISYESASDVLYRVQKIDDNIESTAQSLHELNLRLLGFIAQDFSPDEAKSVIEELGLFLERFGRRFGALRDEIVRDAAEMLLDRHQKRWVACKDKLVGEGSKFKYLSTARIPDPALILANAMRFYGQDGELSSLVNRVNDSARKVWGRLNAKLRELERRNHRLEDIGARLEEFAELSDDMVPHEWFRRLISCAAMRGDPQIRPAGEKSIAPKPKFASHKSIQKTHCWITPCKVGERPNVASISQVRAERLKEWMQKTGIYPRPDSAQMLSSGNFTTYEDCTNIMRVIQTARLQSGEQTRQRIGIQGTPTSDAAHVAIDSASLDFEDIRIFKGQCRPTIRQEARA